MSKERPLKREAKTIEEDVKKFYKKVTIKLPEPRVRERTGKYWKIIAEIAKEHRGTYEIALTDITPDLTVKTAYPSFEKAIEALAKMNGVDTKGTVEESAKGKKKKRTEYLSWKNSNIRLRQVEDKLFIEKLTDKPLLK